MNESRQNDRLDELLKQTLACKEAEFDFAKWKQSHTEEVEAYKNQATGAPAKSRPEIWIIIMHSKMTKLAVAAVVVFGALLLFHHMGGSIDGATVAWAEVVEQLEEVKNIHIVMTGRSSENGEWKMEMWGRMPDHYREENPQQTIIDNGTRRLTINKKTGTAQLSDSHTAVNSRQIDYIMRQSGIFKSPDQSSGTTENEVTFTLLPEESGAGMLVYALQSPSMEGKAWINAHSRLPSRIECQALGQDADTVGNFEIVFDYEPVSDEIFQVQVPADFKTVEEVESRVLSGTVLNEDGAPVARAVVSAGHSSFEPVRTTTNADGEFVIKIPTDIGEIYNLPMMMLALVPDDDELVAWTLVRDPNDWCADLVRSLGGFGGEVPGEVGCLESYNNGMQYRTATGIVLQMEPSGSIWGTVTDDLGDALADVKLTADCWLSSASEGVVYSPFRIGQAKSQADGRYRIANIPPFWERCSFTVRAHKSGYREGQLSFKTSGPLEEHETNISLAKLGEELCITGTVVDNEGNDLEGYYVSARVNGKDSEMERVGKGGRFEIKASLLANDEPEVEVGVLGCLKMANWDRNREFVPYPETWVEVEYQAGKSEYNVEIVTEKPDIGLEVELKNTAGEPVQYFPVALWCPKMGPAMERYISRTDSEGKCTIDGLPRVDGMALQFMSIKTVPGEQLNAEQKAIIEQNSKYMYQQVPVKLAPGQKRYKLSVILKCGNE